MSKAPKRIATADDPFPPWFDGRPLVACRGGPYPQSWEYLERWIENRGPADGTGSWYRRGYVPVGQRVAHPDHPGIKGALLVWDAERAVTLTDEQWLQLLPPETRKAMA